MVSGWLESRRTPLRLCLVRGVGGDRSPLSKTLGTPKFSSGSQHLPSGAQSAPEGLGCPSVRARLARSLLW